MRALVTGGAGFIGSFLVERLLDDGAEVVVLDDLTTGTLANLAAVATHPRLTLRQGSVGDAAAVRACVQGCSILYHMAAAIGVRYIVDDPLGGMRTNVRGTEVVLEAAHEVGCRVVLASSSEVYGRSTAYPYREDGDSVIGPTTISRWSYAHAKALDEHLGLAYYRQHGLLVSVVRYFNIYGPRQRAGGYGVVPRFVSLALRGEPLTVHGTGQQRRCFTYVSDAIEGTLRAGTLPRACGEVYNIGGPFETTILDLAHLVGGVTGSSSPITFHEYASVYGAQFEDTARRVPDTAKAADHLDFVAHVALAEGLGHTVTWWREQLATGQA